MFITYWSLLFTIWALNAPRNSLNWIFSHPISKYKKGNFSRIWGNQLNLTEFLMLAGGTRRTSATAWRRRGSSASSRVCWTWRRASGPPTCLRAPLSPSPSPTSTRPIPTISRFASGQLCTVLRIRDVYPGSDFFPSRIRIKELKYFNPKKMVSKH